MLMKITATKKNGSGSFGETAEFTLAFDLDGSSPKKIDGSQIDIEINIDGKTIKGKTNPSFTVFENDRAPLLLGVIKLKNVVISYFVSEGSHGYDDAHPEERPCDIANSQLVKLLTAK